MNISCLYEIVNTELLQTKIIMFSTLRAEKLRKQAAYAKFSHDN